ncbi:MAG: hypothetical protein LBK13_06840 [Spirochaetales bacterium]|nr:hypothetical protein [Spirochaetales bacterium]
MRFLWAFRSNPLRAPGGSAKSLRDFANTQNTQAASPLPRRQLKNPA